MAPDDVSWAPDVISWAPDVGIADTAGADAGGTGGSEADAGGTTGVTSAADAGGAIDAGADAGGTTGTIGGAEADAGGGGAVGARLIFGPENDSPVVYKGTLTVFWPDAISYIYHRLSNSTP